MRAGDHFDEYLLSHFLRRGPIREHPVGETQECRRVALEELLGAAGVAAANPLQQGQIVAARGHLHFARPWGETPRGGEGSSPRVGIYGFLPPSGNALVSSGFARSGGAAEETDP